MCYLILYHTKDYQGTTTHRQGADRGHQDYTIPRTTRELQRHAQFSSLSFHYTIPRTTRELQPFPVTQFRICHYTIPRTTRELQRQLLMDMCYLNYTIPRTTRELQLSVNDEDCVSNYTIPRTTRELQPAWTIPSLRIVHRMCAAEAVCLPVEHKSHRPCFLARRRIY